MYTSEGDNEEYGESKLMEIDDSLGIPQPTLTAVACEEDASSAVCGGMMPGEGIARRGDPDSLRDAPHLALTAIYIRHTECALCLAP